MSGGPSHPHQDQAGHHHHGRHDHAAGASARMLGWALALTATYMLVQVVGGIVFNSLALLSDAAHMMTDSAALAIALVAIRVGGRAPDARRTFGYRRSEILAAHLNALMLFAVTGIIAVEAVLRIGRPVEVHATGMMVVAAVGLAVNLGAMRLLSSGKAHSLNVKGAYLEVWADMIGSLGVLLGALAISLTGWGWIDTLVAIAICLWVVPRTWMLLRDTVNVLLEGVPSGLDMAALRAAVEAQPGVAGAHDLHVWSMSNDENYATVHLTLVDDAAPDSVRADVTALFGNRFGIHHVTVQTESPEAACTRGRHLHP